MIWAMTSSYSSLLQVKFLLRVSLVCKRFFRLVFQADSLLIDLNDPSLYLDCESFFERNRNANIIEFNRQKLYAILQKFEELKSLKVDLRFHVTGSHFSTHLSLSSGRFHKMLIGFGRNFEFCHLLKANSIHQSNFSVETEVSIDNVQQLSKDDLQQNLVRLASLLDAASTTHELIIDYVLENEKIKSVVLSDHFRKLEIVMDGKRIAALRNKEDDSTVPRRLAVIARRVSAVRLPKLGYTMNDVLFVSVVADKNAEAAEEIVNLKNPMVCSVFRQCGWVAMKVDDVKAVELPIVDFLDFKEGSWAVFQEAFGLLLEEIEVNP